MRYDFRRPRERDNEKHGAFAVVDVFVLYLAVFGLSLASCRTKPLFIWLLNIEIV